MKKKYPIDTIEVKVWMLRNGYKVMDIARDLHVHHSAVVHTLAGRARVPRVVRWLLEHGCPAELLGIEKQEEERRVA